MPRTFNLVMVASEMVPYCKTGGLADVVGALPVELAHLGNKVTAIVPYYRNVALWAEKTGREPKIIVNHLPFFLPGYTGEAIVRELVEKSGLRVLFIDYPSAYDRAELYTEDGRDYPDNISRFAVFSKAALESLKALRIKPEVVHAHDWQASMTAVYLKTHYKDDPFFADTRSIVTIHNLGYQGRFPSEQFPALDLPWNFFTPENLEYFGQVNLLKGGIIFADKITTVSPSYSKEICTPEQGAGLDGLLTSLEDKLSGILNGVDYSAWDPRNDPLIPAPFSAEKPGNKSVSRDALRKEMGLPSKKGPIIGMVTRLAEQKGLELVLESIPDIVKLDCQLVILGTGDPRYHTALGEASIKYSEHIAVKLGFSNPLAHLIEAGSDIFLMPSKYEPCGLNQLYSLRYGTVPLVTSTGGLKDTVENVTPAKLEKDKATGFVMTDFSSAALVKTLKKAVKIFKDQPGVWKKIMVTGMKKDFGWQSQGKKYIALYKSVVEKETIVK